VKEKRNPGERRVSGPLSLVISPRKLEFRLPLSARARSIPCLSLLYFGKKELREEEGNGEKELFLQQQESESPFEMKTTRKSGIWGRKRKMRVSRRPSIPFFSAPFSGAFSLP